MGQTIYKTGQTTGTTCGPVTGTCVGVKYNVAFTSASLEVECSWAAQMRANSGDSGAPVYAATWEGYGIATGIYFASYNPTSGELYTAYYNDWSMLEQEFGTLTAY